jgi:hypothetical protein
VEVPVAPDVAVPLILTSGGRAFAGASFEAESGVWIETFPDGSIRPPPNQPIANGDFSATSPDGRQQWRFDDAWSEIGLKQLLTGTSLAPARLLGHPSVAAFVPSALSRWVLERALRLGLDVEIAPAERGPLGGPDDRQGGVWMRVSASSGDVPASWLNALADLPWVIAARPVGGVESRLWVDVRHGLSNALSLLGAMVPNEELWLLGPPEEGHFLVTLRGAFRPAADFVLSPALPVPHEAVSKAGPARLPEPLPVKLVSMPRRLAASADAVLLDDRELEWLRSFLMLSSWQDRAYIVPGDDRHLLIAQGSLDRVPFGTPLHRVGPGGLYVQSDAGFSPPLPEGARRARFGLTDDAIVVVALDGTWRLSAASLVPAWTLWVGAVPKPLSLPVGRQGASLKSILDAIRLPPEPVPRRPPPPAGEPARDDDERRVLREDAMRDELRGDLVAAAQKLERAGDTAAAGILYERAAGVTPRTRVRHASRVRERGTP